MENLKVIPFQPYMAAFEQLEKITDVASLNEADRARYDESLKVYRDNMAVLAFAEKKAKEKGMEKGMEIVARNMKAKGMNASTIADITGLSLEQISIL